MKKLMIFFSIALAACSSDKVNIADVPAEVKTNFAKMYPDQPDADCEKENGLYEYEFDENGTETCVVFDASGKYIQTEKEIAVSSLPSAVAQYADQNFKGKSIAEASIIVSADQVITYEAEIGKDDYIFDSDGNLVGEEAEDGDDAADDED